MTDPQPNPKKRSRSRKGTQDSSATEQRPPIDRAEELKLWVRSGGRCAFCNKYLLEDDFFIYAVPIGEMAHIVGWKDSTRSPRGKDPLPVEERNNADNLMLVCSEHHQIIDKGKLLNKFPVERLRQQKRDHEERIFLLTSMGPDQETGVIRMFSGIRGAPVELSRQHARDIVLRQERKYARFPFTLHDQGIEIDLSGLPDPEQIWDAYWPAGIATIDRELARVTEAIRSAHVRHLSVFALARIPLLVYLGFRLDDKIPTTIYQKLRSGAESWGWRIGATPASFAVTQLRSSSRPERVVIVLSLSGTIHPAELPEHIDDTFNLFQIAPVDCDPNRDILDARESLEAFSRTFTGLLSQLEVKHKSAQEIHLFPAIPVSAAVACGRAIMRDAQPALKIYDRSGAEYVHALTVNER